MRGKNDKSSLQAQKEQKSDGKTFKEVVSRMERELDKEFGQFNSSKIELNTWIEEASTDPWTVDKTAPAEATAVKADAVEAEAEAMVVPVPVEPPA